MTRPARRKRSRRYRPLARKPGTLTRQEAAEQNEQRRNGPVITKAWNGPASLVSSLPASSGPGG